MEHITQQLAALHAGCSALSWTTGDGKHLWGRNYDFNSVPQGTCVTFFPRGTAYPTCLSQHPDPAVQASARYAALGTGMAAPGLPPILYEGINEKGLMGGQLYYREFAHYPQAVKPGTLPLQPPLAVYHMLAQCATVDEVVRALEQDFTLVAAPLLGTVPTLHWSFSDLTGETIVVEPDQDGLHIYRNTMGVMTNSPSYPWHRTNLLNYAGIRDLDHHRLEVAGDSLAQCFSGSGAQGLPGDWSSPSRFVRLAFLKEYGVKGEDELSGVARMLHLFQSAAMPLGMVRVSEQGHLTQLDTHVIPYDYTAYTSIMCGESLRFYWTTYDNQDLRCVDLSRLLDRDQPAQLPLESPLSPRDLTEEI